MLNQNIDANSAAGNAAARGPRSSALSTATCLAIRCGAISRACGQFEPRPRAQSLESLEAAVLPARATGMTFSG